jgi:hypothetical protein
MGAGQLAHYAVAADADAVARSAPRSPRPASRPRRPARSAPTPRASGARHAGPDGHPVVVAAADVAPWYDAEAPAGAAPNGSAPGGAGPAAGGEGRP